MSCRPAGKLKVSVKARWLKDAKVDVDALTELSFTTHRSTEAGDQPEGYEEQVCAHTSHDTCNCSWAAQSNLQDTDSASKPKQRTASAA